MKVFIIEPCMTMDKVDNANIFNQQVINQLTEYGVVYSVITYKNMARGKQELSTDSTVLIYNEHSVLHKEHSEIQKFLQKALEKNACIMPIAIDKETRMPVGNISKKQSYDIWEQLRCRNLDEQYLNTIAKIFARKIIARAFPTCYCESGEIFLSHRRIDGEEIAARIYDKIIIQAKEATPFRDVVNVKVGEEAQEVIDGAMGNSDVFVFIHTHKSNESDWILKELRFALLRNIPILWVQIDNAATKQLRIKPSDAPHLSYNTEDFSDEAKLTVTVDEILQKAFELIMDRSNQIWGYIELFENLFGDRLSLVDKQKMIYHISMERKGYHYPQRDIEQYYQIFGRTPTVDDAKSLNKDLENIDADSIAILTNRVVSYSFRERVVFDAIQDFFYHWNKYISEEKKGDGKMEIVVSGAFPDSDEIFKQSLTDALILFSKTIIQNGYELTFGSHPTFQELFYEIAKEVEPENYKNIVNMYISQWFLEKEAGKEIGYREKYNLYITDKKCDLPLSLEEMRTNMIQRKNVKALVCLGGKIKDNKEDEGIRKEIEIAREVGIPVFIVGSVGGCSSEVAVEYKNIGWDKLNAAPDEVNDEFLEGIDYFNMAQKMIQFLGSESNEDK